MTFPPDPRKAELRRRLSLYGLSRAVMASILRTAPDTLHGWLYKPDRAVPGWVVPMLDYWWRLKGSRQGRRKRP